MRKDLATRCIKLNLNDDELKDLAGIMGHHVNVRTSHYRKHIIARDIPLFVKFLNAATSNFDEEVSKSKSVQRESTGSNADAEEIDLKNSAKDSAARRNSMEKNKNERKGIYLDYVCTLIYKYE